MMTIRKRIFLLGGTGFVGSAVTRALAANRRENELMMLVHRRAPFRELEQVNTHTGSLGSLDLSLLDRFKPDSIVHLARMSGRGKLGRYLAAGRGARANQRLIGHLERKPDKPHVIYVSGTLVYGDCGHHAVDEDRPIHPLAFAREYIKAEQPWMNALRLGELPVTILRPPWIMGQGSWFADFYLNEIRRHRRVPLFGDGRNLMSLIDVEDCAGLVAHAVRHSVPGRCYNLFTPGVAAITQREFAEKLAAHSGTEVWKLDPSEIRNRHGEAVLEAFTFSNRSATKYPEFLSGYNFKYPSVDEMIMNNLPAGLDAMSGDHALARKE